MCDFVNARQLLSEFKGASYHFGHGVLSRIGKTAGEYGKAAVLIDQRFPGSEVFVEEIVHSLEAEGVTLAARIEGARPNTPMEDLERITAELSEHNPDVVISFGGGSTIDAGKAAIVLMDQGGSISDYFGTGLVTKALSERGGRLTPHIAVQTAASSAAHLTRYSNITDTTTNQKKLIVDEAIVPGRAVFDSRVTYTAPRSLTADGALDGVAHIVEVLYGAVGKPSYEKMERIAETGVSLILRYLPRVLDTPADKEAREALCLATDLGGCAIMTGGTNGGHLTSFSLVDVLSHGRACAIMNPYYTVFFAPAIEKPLRLLGTLYQRHGYIEDRTDLNVLSGRELGVALAEGMIAFQESIGFPTQLNQVPGFDDAHIEKAVTAAKNPQLRMKLENMPIPLSVEMIDGAMRPILLAAKHGDMSLIR